MTRTLDFELPKDAYIMVDVDGTLKNAHDDHTENAALCNLLRGRKINLLTAMGLSNILHIASIATMRADNSPKPLTRPELIEKMKLNYGIITERVIIPADAAYVADDPTHRKAGDTYKDLIEPYYPVLHQCLATQTSPNANVDYSQALQAFTQNAALSK